MKKLLSVLLIVSIILSLNLTFVSAAGFEECLGEGFENLTVSFSDGQKDVFTEKWGDEEIEFTNYFITTNTVLTINFPVDHLSVYDNLRNYECYASPTYMCEPFNDYTATVVENIASRKDNINFDSTDSETTTIDYFKKGTKLKFNRDGAYTIFISVGVNNTQERLEMISHPDYEKYVNKDGHMTMYLDVTVEFGDDSQSPNLFGDENNNPDPDYTAPEKSKENYNKDLITLSGVEQFMPNAQYAGCYCDYPLAYATAPVVITAKKNLDDFVLYKMRTDKNGGLTEDFKPICPDGKLPKDYDWADYDERFGPDSDEQNMVEYIPAKKGEKYTIKEPGYYSFYATVYDFDDDPSNDIYTAFIIKITDLTATYTSSKVLVNNKEVKFEAYNIEGNNYFKLRDIAAAINGTDKQFNIVWDAAESKIKLTPGEAYQAVGGELKAGDGKSKKATYGSTALYMHYDSEPIDARAYLINDNNYFKLRDLGMLFGFNVSWDGKNNCVIIDTSKSYDYNS